VANKILNIIFKADASDAVREIDKLKGKEGTADGGGGTGIAGLSGYMTTTMKNASIVGGILLGIGTIVKNSEDTFITLSREIDSLASAFGISNKEASGFLQMSETFGLSTGGMYTALNGLIKEGFDPTLEGLADFKEELDTMDDPKERALKALKVLGTEGQQALAPLISGMDAVELQAYIDTLLEGSGQVSDLMMQNAQDLAIATEGLSVAWGHLNTAFANWAAPGLTALIELLLTKPSADSMAAFIKGFFGKDFGKIEINTPNLMGYQEPAKAAAPTYWSGHATGGSFTVPGFGGMDSVPVSFRASPGEHVTVGQGGSDVSGEILAEIRRLVRTLPAAIRDSVERS
jgi:hypothetical protein